MKKKIGTELKDLTDQELMDKLQEERGALTKLRFNHTVSPIENPMLLRMKRRDVARAMTEVRRREIKNNAKA